jgi:hypothetical protein
MAPPTTSGWFPPGFREVDDASDADDVIRLPTKDAITAWNALSIELARRIAPHVTVLHAGAVAIGDRGVAIVGTSGSGKTTITNALITSGATYLSDEFAVISQGPELLPWPKPLNIKPTAELRLPPTTTNGCHPVGLHALLLLHHDADARELDVERLPPSRAMLELLAHALGERSEGGLDRLAHVVRAVPVWSGRRGDAADAASEIVRFVAPSPV